MFQAFYVRFAYFLFLPSPLKRLKALEFFERTCGRCSSRVYSLASTRVRPVFTFEIGAEKNKQQSAQKRDKLLDISHPTQFFFLFERLKDHSVEHTYGYKWDNKQDQKFWKLREG